MKIKTRICLITIVSLVTCCFGLWFFNYLSTHNLINDIKEIESCDEKKSYAKLIAIEDTGNKNFNRLWLGLVFVVTLGGGTSFFAIRKALKPFKDLTNHIKDFHTDDLKKSIPLPKVKDESYELISSYNTMLNRLNQAFERERRVTANIAHEFKTPLSVLITSCEVLEMKPNPSIEDYKRVINITKEKADYLSEITSSLLTIHRQTHKLNNARCFLPDLLMFVRDNLINSAKKRNISIEIKCPDIYIFCDRLLFGQMINNFVDNAIKYNNDNGFINIVVEEEIDNAIAIYISDTGKGIPDDLKDLVFEPFFRVDKSRNKEYGGVGLGLSFSKVVADLYSGVITIEDNKPSGSRFILRFPKIIAG